MLGSAALLQYLRASNRPSEQPEPESPTERYQAVKYKVKSWREVREIVEDNCDDKSDHGRQGGGQ